MFTSQGAKMKNIAIPHVTTMKQVRFSFKSFEILSNITADYVGRIFFIETAQLMTDTGERMPVPLFYLTLFGD